MQLKKYIVSVGFIGLVLLSWGQSQIGLTNNGANLVITAGTNLLIMGDLTHQNKGQIVNNGVLKLRSHFIQNTGAIYIDSINGSLSFEGNNTLQMFDADSKTPVSVSNLSVSNQDELTLATDLVIRKGLNLFPNTKLRLNDYNILLDSNIVYHQIGSTNYIKTNGWGTVQQILASKPRFFHIGNSSYNPVQFLNTGITDTFSIRVMDGAPQSFNSLSSSPYGVVKRVWQVHRKLNHFLPAVMEVYWSESEEGDYFDRKKSVLSFTSTLNSFTPTIASPAVRVNDFWKTINDELEIKGMTDYFWVEEAKVDYPNNATGTLSAQPNPADTYINLSVSAEDVGKEYSISNMSGNVVQIGKIVSKEQQIDTSNLPAGIYYINIGAIGTTRTKFVKL
jgi:hypothetical protein